MKKKERFEALLKGHTLRYVRCYDSGPNFADRYTVVYTGRRGGSFVGLSDDPYHPQGIAMHGEGLPDRRRYDGGFLWPPSLGRSNHLGTRIDFKQLPVACQRLVVTEYCDFWGIDYYEAWDYCELGGTV